MTSMHDVLVIGAGALGLWCAKKAVDAGLTVCLADAGSDLDHGRASDTPLGALLPHLPENWSPAKQYQYEALVALPTLVRDLEETTGTSTEYKRRGRVMPIRKVGFRQKVERASLNATQHWAPSGDVRPRLTLQDGPANGTRFGLAEDAAPLGLVHDTLSATVSGPALCAALRASLAGRVTWLDGTVVTDWDAQQNRAFGRDGSPVADAEHLIVTGGFAGFELLERLMGVPLGDGVKGHAAVIAADLPTDLPVLYDNGTYVIARSDGTAAIGSTTEFEWTSAEPEHSDSVAQMIARAETLCPALAGRALLGLWAGIRPRAVGRDPLIGCLDRERRIWVATGGYKITLGIAHRLADALVSELTGTETAIEVPATFRPAHHLTKAKDKLARAKRNPQTP